MGLSLTMQMRACWLFAMHRALRICSTTPPREAWRTTVAFLTPQKRNASGSINRRVARVCDRHSGVFRLSHFQGHQPDSFFPSPTLPIPQAHHPNSSTDSLPLDSFTGAVEPITFGTDPASRPIASSRGFAPASLPATPPLTPDNGPASAGGMARLVQKMLRTRPHSTFSASSSHATLCAPCPHASSIKINISGLGTVWDGVILDLNGKKTLYVNGKGAEHVQLRESIVALLDLADEQFGCSAFVIALDRSSSALGDLIHSLMYVSGTIVTHPPFAVDPAYVLVGIEM
ncbi:ornithine decarboxylase antizyme-domain-containing protein [Auriculariales sp. MPI-PUGE-AT-0066]|nr:ornithine decarboxylase antizyme-domain-containing protein [Auriculariales sp. MPI-PUGE-AT-0066]